MAEPNKHELKYYENNGKPGNIELELRFLTPALRVELIDIETELQKELKKAAKQFNINETEERISQETKNMAAMGYNSEIMTLKIVDLLSEEDLDIQRDAKKEFIKISEKHEMVFLKHIVEYSSLNNHQKKLWDTEYEGEFWRNTNFYQVAQINKFFRNKYNLTGRQSS